MTQISVPPSKTSHRPPASWAYAWWALTGFLAGFGVAGILTVGILLLPVAITLGITGVLWKPLRNRAAVLLFAGLAGAPAYLAWVNREGPGTVCNTVQDVTECSEQWTPWPFVGIAAVMIATAVIAAIGARRLR